MLRRHPLHTRSGVGAGVVVVSATVMALTLSGCAGDEPRASAPSPKPMASEPTPSVEVPSLASGEVSSVPLDDEPVVTAGELPENSDVIVADSFDTNAPVQVSELPEGITATQLQALRGVWSQRQPSLTATTKAAAADPAFAGSCEVHPGEVWIRYLNVQQGAPVVALGVGAGGPAVCDWREAVLLVDTEKNTVRGESTLAFLL